jgi:hypothetical protein
MLPSSALFTVDYLPLMLGERAFKSCAEFKVDNDRQNLKLKKDNLISKLFSFNHSNQYLMSIDLKVMTSEKK